MVGSFPLPTVSYLPAKNLPNRENLLLVSSLSCHPPLWKALQYHGRGQCKTIKYGYDISLVPSLPPNTPQSQFENFARDSVPLTHINTMREVMI